MNTADYGPPGKEYDWGHTGKLRAMRDYLGAGKIEMAKLLGIALRSYKRMESGEIAIPETLWTEITKLHDRQDHEVQMLTDAAAAGNIDRLAVSPSDTDWARMVVARSMRKQPRIHPYLPDDADALKEMTGENAD